MSCLGVHFSLTADEVAKLKSFKKDEQRLEYLQEELEEAYFAGDRQFIAETDKAWDAIHRALTDGQLAYDNGEFPLSHVILGGEPLYFSGDYIMSLKTPEEIRSIAEALKSIGREELHRRYCLIDTDEYGCSVDDEDFEYTWHSFEDLVGFFERAANQGRFVLFTADQ
jgi:hypothetical protein